MRFGRTGARYLDEDRGPESPVGRNGVGGGGQQGGAASSAERTKHAARLRPEPGPLELAASAAWVEADARINAARLETRWSAGLEYPYSGDSFDITESGARVRWPMPGSLRPPSDGYTGGRGERPGGLRALDDPYGDVRWHDERGDDAGGYQEPSGRDVPGSDDAGRDHHGSDDDDYDLADGAVRYDTAGYGPLGQNSRGHHPHGHHDTGANRVSGYGPEGYPSTDQDAGDYDDVGDYDLVGNYDDAGDYQDAGDRDDAGDCDDAGDRYAAGYDACDDDADDYEARRPARQAADRPRGWPPEPAPELAAYLDEGPGPQESAGGRMEHPRPGFIRRNRIARGYSIPRLPRSKRSGALPGT